MDKAKQEEKCGKYDRERTKCVTYQEVSHSEALLASGQGGGKDDLSFCLHLFLL